MRRLEVDEETHATIKELAVASSRTEAEIVRAAIEALRRAESGPNAPNDA